MVHKTFKLMVPKTNRKIVELDLIKRYNTIFAIRHLVDGGIDRRLLQSNSGFTSIQKSNKNLFANWYVTEDNRFSQDYENEINETNETSGKYSLQLFICFVIFKFLNITFCIEQLLSTGHFRDVRLRQRISLKDMKSFLTYSLQDINFKMELFECYKELNLNSAIISSSLTWYQCISYTTEDDYGNAENVCLQLGDIVTIQEEEYDESYAILQSIFQHKGNNNRVYIFIIIAWFEYTNQQHSVLECPIYKLDNQQKWRRIFPITVIDKVHKAYFIHNENNTNEENYWFKNQFYFTVI